MQTILGSGGAIGTLLAKELSAYTDKIRLVSRNPKKVNENDELFPADITNAEQLDRAIAGSKVAYVTVGFEYNIKAWQTKWPPFIRNVIDSCRQYNTNLVFFDNIYMYDREYLNRLTEKTPIRPTTRKGKVRAEIATMILDEIDRGRINALIARSADFYGVKNSIMVELVIKNMMKNKRAMWFADARKIHTFTSAEDAARATALLGNTPDAYGQVWHLPTDNSPLTGKDWIELVARILNKKPSYSVLPSWMVSFTGLFVPLFRELSEMIYQYEQDYVFNSSKFEKRFAFVPQKPEAGVARLISLLGQSSSNK
jgi:nucleoside-diphosphate-sugar epimerase